MGGRNSGEEGKWWPQKCGNKQHWFSFNFYFSSINQFIFQARNKLSRSIFNPMLSGGVASTKTLRVYLLLKSRGLSWQPFWHLLFRYMGWEWQKLDFSPGSLPARSSLTFLIYQNPIQVVKQLEKRIWYCGWNLQFAGRSSIHTCQLQEPLAFGKLIKFWD